MGASPLNLNVSSILGSTRNSSTAGGASKINWGNIIGSVVGTVGGLITQGQANKHSKDQAARDNGYPNYNAWANAGFPRTSTGDALQAWRNNNVQQQASAGQVQQVLAGEGTINAGAAAFDLGKLISFPEMKVKPDIDTGLLIKIGAFIVGVILILKARGRK